MAIGLFLLHVTWLPLRNLQYLARYAPFYTLVTLVTAFVLWKLWKGRNWARWIVMVMCVGTICMLYQFKGVSPFWRVWLVNQAAFSAWLLYWLNSASVRAWFVDGRRSGAA